MNAAVRTALHDVQALTFDIFGTVVDWRGSIEREGAALNRLKGIELDWGAVHPLRAEGKAHPIEEVGRRMRELMSWLRDARKDSSEAPRKPRPAAQA